MFRQWSAPRHQQKRYVGAVGVGQSANGIGRTHVDVQHYRQRLAGDHGIAMGHGYGDIFMGHHQGLRAIGIAPVFPRLRQGLDQWREISARIGQEILDTRGTQTRQNRVRDGCLRCRHDC